jgi:hypothetical protein
MQAPLHYYYENGMHYPHVVLPRKLDSLYSYLGCWLA